MLDLSIKTTAQMERSVFPFYTFVAPEAGEARPQRVWVKNAQHFKALATQDANRPYLFRALSQQVKPLLSFGFKQQPTSGELMYADNPPRLVHYTPQECKPQFETDKKTLAALGRFLRRTVDATQRREFAFHLRQTLGITQIRPDLADYNPNTMTVAGQPLWETPGTETTTASYRMLRQVVRGKAYMRQALAFLPSGQWWDARSLALQAKQLSKWGMLHLRESISHTGGRATRTAAGLVALVTVLRDRIKAA